MPLQYYDVYWPTWVKGTVHQNNEKFSHYLLTSVPMLSQVKFLHPQKHFWSISARQNFHFGVSNSFNYNKLDRLCHTAQMEHRCFLSLTKNYVGNMLYLVSLLENTGYAVLHCVNMNTVCNHLRNIVECDFHMNVTMYSCQLSSLSVVFLGGFPLSRPLLQNKLLLCRSCCHNYTEMFQHEFVFIALWL